MALKRVLMHNALGLQVADMAYYSTNFNLPLFFYCH